MTITHYGFFSAYWALPHDGRRIINSDAQQALIDLAVSRHEIADPASGRETDAHRARVGREVWEAERGFAVGVLLLGFAVKVRFAVRRCGLANEIRMDVPVRACAEVEVRPAKVMWGGCCNEASEQGRSRNVGCALMVGNPAAVDQYHGYASLGMISAKASRYTLSSPSTPTPPISANPHITSSLRPPAQRPRNWHTPTRLEMCRCCMISRMKWSTS